jgi:hypothetical protein
VAILGLRNASETVELRVRWDGIFASFADAQQLTDVVGGLALGGPPGIGAGLGAQPSLAVESIAIAKELVPRADARWALWRTAAPASAAQEEVGATDRAACVAGTFRGAAVRTMRGVAVDDWVDCFEGPLPQLRPAAMQPAVDVPWGACEVELYDVAHARSGDKGNTVNISLIPYDPRQLPRLKAVVTAEWLRGLAAMRPLVDRDTNGALEAAVFELPGTAALNLVVSPVLDGGVSVSRRIDIHGKSFSDLLLQQTVRLPAMARPSDARL